MCRNKLEKGLMKMGFYELQYIACVCSGLGILLAGIGVLRAGLAIELFLSKGIWINVLNK